MVDRGPRARPRLTLSVLVRGAVFLLALAGYVGILLVRQGPPPAGDTTPLTAVTTALSHGDLGAAATVASLPDPPGYPLLVSPLVVLFRPLIGSATWCTTPGRAAVLRHDPALRRQPDFAGVIGECGFRSVAPDGHRGTSLPPWYRAQGLLGILAWVVLVAGSWTLLRTTEAAGWKTELALLVFLVILPSASSAIVQLFHPQDLVSFGLSAAALAFTVRRRWVTAGVLFGLAFLTKQFAVLVLLPALVAAPDGRSRRRLVVPAVAVAVVGLLPFLAVAPHATLDNLSGIGAGGAVTGATLLSIVHASPTVSSVVARDLPVAFALLASWWAWRRAGPGVLGTGPLLGLVLACVASRLVFESVIFPYYLLAASVAFVLLDLGLGRLPDRSLAWVAATAAFVALRPDDTTVDAIGTLILAAIAVACGLREVARATGPRGPADPDVAPATAAEPAPGRGR